MITFKCSECDGDILRQKNVYKCTKCGRERKLKEKTVKVIDMSETADLTVIMEGK